MKNVLDAAIRCFRAETVKIRLAGKDSEYRQAASGIQIAYLTVSNSVPDFEERVDFSQQSTSRFLPFCVFALTAG